MQAVVDWRKTRSNIALSCVILAICGIFAMFWRDRLIEAEFLRIVDEHTRRPVLRIEFETFNKKCVCSSTSACAYFCEEMIRKPNGGGVECDIRVVLPSGRTWHGRADVSKEWIALDIDDRTRDWWPTHHLPLTEAPSDLNKVVEFLTENDDTDYTMMIIDRSGEITLK